jgi:hypothetical protein
MPPGRRCLVCASTVRTSVPTPQSMTDRLVGMIRWRQMDGKDPSAKVPKGKDPKGKDPKGKDLRWPNG